MARERKSELEEFNPTIAEAINPIKGFISYTERNRGNSYESFEASDKFVNGIFKLGAVHGTLLAITGFAVYVIVQQIS